ncbi:MAG: TetR/AcrR family transcriptional regulator [Rickettsiales bacterium]
MSPSTREKILDATTELLWQQSYGAVSVDEICKEASVKKGSFYHYFPSKVDVVIESFERQWEMSRPFFDEIFSPSLKPLDRLKKLCDAAYERQKEKAEKYGKVLGCPYMACGSELSTQDERIRQKMDELFGRTSKYYESLIRDARAEGLTSATNAKIMGQEMQSYIAGVMYQAKIKNDLEVIRRDLFPGLLRFFDRYKPTKTKTDRSVKKTADA